MKKILTLLALSTCLLQSCYKEDILSNPNTSIPEPSPIYGLVTFVNDSDHTYLVQSLHGGFDPFEQTPNSKTHRYLRYGYYTIKISKIDSLSTQPTVKEYQIEVNKPDIIITYP